MTDIDEAKWFQLFSTSQNSISIVYEKKTNFYGFPCSSTCDDFSIDVLITTVGLILTKPPESEIEVVECFNMCKAAMERKGPKVNNGKMKILVSGKECDSVVTLGNTLVKSVIVGFVVKSVRCNECTKWIYKQCSE